MIDVENFSVLIVGYILPPSKKYAIVFVTRLHKYFNTSLT